MVLLRQHLGRRHERGLFAGFHRAQHRQDGDEGLAGADVALQEPEHPPFGGEVGVDLRQGLGLRGREGMSEAFQRLGAITGVTGQRVALTAAHPASDDGERDLAGEELIVCQPCPHAFVRRRLLRLLHCP